MKSTATERTVSGLLIGAATSLIATAIFLAPSVMDKVSSTGLIVCFVTALAGLTSLAGSIAAGGRGMTKGASTGPNNAFDLQAKLIIVGFVFLVITAGCAVIFPKSSEAESGRAAQRVDDRLSRIESRVAKLEKDKASAAMPVAQAAPNAPIVNPSTASPASVSGTKTDERRR